MSDTFVHLPACHYRRERWRNHQGWTREILRVPDAEGFHWRASIAEIGQDTLFSPYPGYQRVQVLLQGEALRLGFVDGRRVLLERRPPVGIWGGLLALPEQAHAAAGDFARLRGCRLLECHELPALQHTFSHFRQTLRALLCRVERSADQAGEPGWEWLRPDEIDSAALPTPIRRLLRQALPAIR